MTWTPLHQAMYPFASDSYVAGGKFHSRREAFDEQVTKYIQVLIAHGVNPFIEDRDNTPAVALAEVGSDLDRVYPKAAACVRDHAHYWAQQYY